MPKKSKNKSVRRTHGQGWEFIPANPKPVVTKRTKSEDASQQTIKIREEKRNKGKMVTACYGFQLTDRDLKALAKTLKATCGSGGTAQPGKSARETGTIEVQGQHLSKVREILEKEGYKIQG